MKPPSKRQALVNVSIYQGDILGTYFCQMFLWNPSSKVSIWLAIGQHCRPRRGRLRTSLLRDHQEHAARAGLASSFFLYVAVLLCCFDALGCLFGSCCRLDNCTILCPAHHYRYKNPGWDVAEDDQDAAQQNIAGTQQQSTQHVSPCVHHVRLWPID